jgi:hypothetical protein
MPAPRNVHGASTRVLSGLMVVIGVALVISTVVRGGGPLAVGVLLGLGFCAVGAGRLYLEARR